MISPVTSKKEKKNWKLEKILIIGKKRKRNLYSSTFNVIANQYVYFLKNRYDEVLQK